MTTNHNPTFTSSAATVSFSENTNTTNSASPHISSGTLSFKDSDKTDTHTVSASLRSAAWSGGSSIPASSLADLNAALSASVLTDSNGSGTIKWTFSDPDKDFDFLAKGETLVLTYNVTVKDNHGGTATQTVTVTVTGTDDTPVIGVAAHATVTEQPGQLLSFAPDVAHVALNFTDPDLNNTNYSATVTGVSASGATGGLLPGSLGTAELLAFFNVDNVAKAKGASSGTINTTFAAPDLAFDYLAAGQHLDITYTVQLDDHAGGVTNQTVVITVVGTNDKPIYLSGPESAHLIEGQHVSSGGNLTANGDLIFTDVDLSDTHSVSTTVTATRSGGGSIPIANAALLAAMSTSVVDSTGHLLGDVDWNFAIANSDISFLSAGETLTLAYHLAVVDPSGGADTQTVTVTILGTNHPVVITSGPESASVAELDATTGSPALDMTSPVPTGTIAFSDADTGDTHTVAVTVGSQSWSGGASIPAATQSALASALATTLHDSTGSGTGGIDWTFSVADNALDFLAAGETLTVTYNVKVSDASTSATQTVTITAAGSNDAPVITSGPEAASLSELPGVTGSSAVDTTSPVPTGTLSFTDADLTDMHSVAVTLDSFTWSGGLSDLVPFQTQNDLLTALATMLHDSTGTGSGGVDWTFGIPDKDLDFLAAGETLTVTYDVAVNDASIGSTQTVTITLSGATDPGVVNPVTAMAIDTPFPDTGNLVAVGNLITDVGDSGGDLSNTLSVTAVNGNGANVGNFISGTYGDLLVTSDGFYFFFANGAVDPLQVGQSPTETFSFTVTDSHGNNTDTTLTVDVVGADDLPAITAASAFGSITEDAGPSTVVNGGFETGDLTGWLSSHANVQLLAIGGEFGLYSARLGPATFGTLSQDIATTPGQHYTLSFYVAGDTESSSNSVSASWDGTTLFGQIDNFAGGLTKYTFDVVGDATHSTTQLDFQYTDDGTGLILDQVQVQAPAAGGTESANGSISFSDVETGDTHTAGFTPQSGGYVGTFTLDPVSETPGSGSVGWHFSIDNADIQFLARDQTVAQIYSVVITDSNGASTEQDVTVTLNGTNDAPTANGETIVTDVGTSGSVVIPGWAITHNDIDPDTTDTVAVNSVSSASGGAAGPSGDSVDFFDDTILGGSFVYDVTDGIAVSGPATATVVNNDTGATVLTGTSGNDIIIATNGGETLDGGGGNDILIGNGGSHVETGGTGDDIFAFQHASDGPVTITDFNNVTEHDRIAVSANGFGLMAGQDPSTVFESSGDDQFIFANFHYDTSNQTLYFSPDGTTASAQTIATFQPGVLLNAHDLLLV